jgi:DNA mismatch repair protein MutL
MQYTYVNGRYVRNRTLLHAIAEAYRRLMTSDRRPVCFLLLTMDPRAVDVNVHPTKLEIKFRQPGDVHQQVLNAMRECLREAKITPQVTLTRGGPGEESREAVRRAIGDFFSGASSGNQRPAPAAVAATEGGGQGAPAVARSRFGNCMQVLDTYLVEEEEQGLCIIDQHALHEAILYNEIEDRLEQGSLNSQQLLVPELVELPRQEFYAVMEMKEQLARFGMEIEAFGEQTVIVRSFPQILDRFDGRSFFEDLLAELEGPEGARKVDGRLEKVVKMMACRAAVKAGQRLSPEQIRHLLAKRRAGGPTDNCPHGRPTTIRLRKAELDRKFRRT